MAENEKPIQAEESGRLHDSEAFAETHDEKAFKKRRGKLRAARDWRAAESLLKLKAQVNAAFPNRSKSHDGMIGDSSHCPGTSDHCPNIIDGGVGVVTAFDITHDPAHGCDMRELMESIRTSRDNRVKYVIYDHWMYSSYDHLGVLAWRWRPYSGSNPHTTHAHVSVLGQKTKYDDDSDWDIS